MKKFLTLFIVTSLLSAKAQIISPKEEFGFEPGADYKLANYDQMLSYYTKLADQSPRVIMEEIGKTTLGKPMIILIISSEENLQNLEEYRSMSEKLAKARVSMDEARELSKEGKAIVWIDGGLHATEVAGAQMTPELAYNMATSDSDEIKNIRDRVILILMPVMNPDGLDIVSSWYERNLGTPFETSRPPWLYHHYIGHDNNRDWFMNNMPESYHVNDQLYRRWYPQIVYNHHQTSPAWARIFIPPFRSPVNPRIHPGTTTGTNLIGTVMANRFAMKKMPGVVSYQSFSMWWNGGMRTVPYFHNMVGILSETAHATPTPRFYDPAKKPSSIGGSRGGMATDGTQIFYPYPWEGGESKFRHAVEYMLTGSMAVLDFAADRKEEYLYNIYDMGKDAINGELLGDDFTYIIPRKQANKVEVINLVNLLWHGGIEVQEATAKFEYNEREFEKGDILISSRQAFRPYLEDLMEVQSYPDQRLYPGGPPNPPYDLAGWTLPMQMGINVIKTEGEINVKSELVTELMPLINQVPGGKASYYLLETEDNASFMMINKLLSDNIDVYRAQKDMEEITQGDFVIDANLVDTEKISSFQFGATLNKMKKVNLDNGFKKLEKKKVGLYKSWVSNMDEGWTRWLLTQYYFDWDTLHNDQVINGDLNQYDVIIIPDQSNYSIINGHREGTMPDEFVGGIGLEGVLKLKNYVMDGGTLITLDGSSELVLDHFGIPVRNVTSNRSPQQFFVPGSLLRGKVYPTPFSWGVPEEVALSFSRSSAFRVSEISNTGEGGEERTVERAEKPEYLSVVDYNPENMLMSGWAMGEKGTLGGNSGMLVFPFGKGNLILFGFRPQFRGQPRATYKLLFNSILNSN